MEALRDNLIRAKEVVALCKKREKWKRHLALVALLGTILLLNIDLDAKHSLALGLHPNHEEYKEDLAALDADLMRKGDLKQPPAPTPSQPAPTIVSRQPPVPKPPPALVPEHPLLWEGNRGLCNFEFACIMSALIQKAGNVAVLPRTSIVQEIGPAPQPEPSRLPKPPVLHVERRRRLGRCGELFIDRRLVLATTLYPYEPAWAPSLTPASAALYKTRHRKQYYDKNSSGNRTRPIETGARGCLQGYLHIQ